MIHVWATVEISDLERFIGVFATAGARARRGHGSRSSRVFTVPGHPDQVRVLFEWESREAFEGFLNDPAVRPTMQSSGTVGRPDFLILEALADLPGYGAGDDPPLQQKPPACEAGGCRWTGWERGGSAREASGQVRISWMIGGKSLTASRTAETARAQAVTRLGLSNC